MFEQEYALQHGDIVVDRLASELKRPGQIGDVDQTRGVARREGKQPRQCVERRAGERIVSAAG